MEDGNKTAAELFGKFIPRQQFCDAAGITYRTAELWAHQRKGPKVTILGRRAYYHADDVAAWLEEQHTKNADRAPRKRGAA